VLIALGVSLLTLYSMLKIWNGAFWKPRPEASEPAGRASARDAGSAGGSATAAATAAATAVIAAERTIQGTRLPLAMMASIVLLVACSLALSVAAAPVFELADAAALQLMEPAGYIEAVLGAAR
jgi:multicomponent Na+:H+ antiporter subunit D